jgi:hypothetical protein
MGGAKRCLPLGFLRDSPEKMFSRKLRPKDGHIPRSSSYSTPHLSRSIGNASSFIATFGNWPWFPKDRLEEPESTLESIHADYQDSPVDTAREVRELVAKCLWDVFSNENEVVDRDGRLVDIGSWRGAGGFLADQLNRETGERQYDYIDFYIAVRLTAGGRATTYYEIRR